MDEDTTDAAWAQLQLEEEQMLTQDPGYFHFLQTYAQESYGLLQHQG